MDNKSIKSDRRFGKVSGAALKAFALVLLFSLGYVAKPEAAEMPSGKWVDLTHDFSSETIYWPTGEGFKLETVFEGMTEKGYFYEAKKYRAEEHGGTHIDAPVHFAEGMKTVDEIPLDRLTGPAVVIDVSERATKDPDYLVSVEDITGWEKVNGAIPEGTIVLLNTGYGRYWPDRAKYMGTDEKGPEAVKDLRFPGLGPEAAKWLVDNRKISAVGIDTASIDYGQSKLFETHRILSKNNVPAFENVANLDELPAKGALVFALPMKIKDGSGGPLRIIALVPESR
ncbi:MAG: cyclase family protein [Candidatus Dadabacteria bacterium]